MRVEYSEGRSILCESPAEEVANIITHGFGALLGVAATVVMIVLAVPHSAWHVVSVSVFGASLILLYTCSTIYHWTTSHHGKLKLQIADHVLIFVLIAGSYTPWLLVSLRGPWGWSLFGAVWVIAVCGTYLKIKRIRGLEKVSSFLYIAMGWIIVLAFRPLMENVNSVGVSWLVAGGLSYTVGVAFFAMQRVRFAHAIWHLFVLTGSACHVYAVIRGVLIAQ